MNLVIQYIFGFNNTNMDSYLSTSAQTYRFTHQGKEVCVSNDSKPVELDANDSYVAALIRQQKITKVSVSVKPDKTQPSNV